MKIERYVVIHLDKRNGWMMFATSPEGFHLSHNPLQAAIFEENKAEEIVCKMIAQVAKTTPAFEEYICISKVKLA